MALTQLSSYTLTYPLAQPFGTAPIGACSSLCKLSLGLEKNALTYPQTVLEKIT